MPIAVIAILALLLLTGLVTLGMGHRGWSWGTVVAGILTLLAASGAAYMVTRLAERERAWTNVIRRYETDILRVRDAQTLDGRNKPQPLAGEKSLVQLAAEANRWRRAWERVDTWRGRFWQKASFTPPRNDQPGTILLAEQTAPAAADAAAAPEAAAEPAEPAPPAAPAERPVPINAGAQVAVFDDAAFEAGGRFLGLFRVVSAAFDAATRRTTLQVVPAARPDKADERAWSKTYESVTVYEDLPVDRWLAFHRMPSQAAADGPLPDPAKADAQELLARLERLEQELARHDTEVEGEPAELARRIESGEVPLDRYWAVVEFTAAHDLGEAVVKRITALLAPDIDDEDKVRKSFEPGDKAEFDLRTALDLGGKVKILRVVDRRPLADAATSLLGGPIADGGEGPRADGLAALRRMLEDEIVALEQATARLASSQQNVVGQRARFEEDRLTLEADLREWQLDVTAAEASSRAFADRLDRVSGDLTAALRAIGLLGRELTAGAGRLAAEIDRRAPAAVRDGGRPR